MKKMRSEIEAEANFNNLAYWCMLQKGGRMKCEKCGSKFVPIDALQKKCFTCGVIATCKEKDKKKA